jgi:hypothetical protein
MTKLGELSEDEFDERYPLRNNHLNDSVGWCLGEDGGCLFETHGEELAFVKQQDRRCVWTLLDGTDGEMYVISGMHFVNRIGYLVNQHPVPEGTTIEVHIPCQIDSD